MSSFDVVIVGGGIVGTSAAYYLARGGRRVLLLDQFTVPNEWAVSGDHARVFRYTFGKDLFYTELAVKSLHLWKEFQKEAHEELYVNTGMLDLAAKDGGYEEHCYRSLTGMRLPVEKLDAAEMRERYRIFNPKAMRFAVYHPDGGMLWAQRAVTAFSAAASKRKGVVHPNVKAVSVVAGKEGVREVRDQNGRSWKGASYLFAPGPWAKELLSAYRLPLQVTRQRLLYFRPPTNQGRYRPGHCPVFSSSSGGYHGFPVHIHGFMKIEEHRKGPPCKPGTGAQDIPPQFERNCRQFLKKFLPDVSGFQDTEGKVCYYNNTPDGDFILDWLPGATNACVATGLSGHGFMFGPLIGQTASELLVSGKTDVNLNRFRLARFSDKKAKRSV